VLTGFGIDEYFTRTDLISVRSDSLAERGEFELSGDFVKPFSKPLLLLVADEKLTGGQPLQRESQAQVIEHQALEFAGQ
jgi:hypothetical protein